MTTPRLQINVDEANNGLCPFLNWAHHKQATGGFIGMYVSGAWINGTALSTASRLNSNGEVIDITNATKLRQYISLEYSTDGLTGNEKSGTRSMKYTWDGQTVTGVSGQVSNVSFSANSATFDINLGSNVYIDLDIDPAQGDGSPPTNRKIFEASKEADLASYIMDGDWIDFYKRFAIIRLMNPMGTNPDVSTLTEAVNYTDLPTTSDVFWGGYSKTAPQKVGWPVDALIEIANRTGRPIWINIPYLFTDAAVTSLSNALRDGINWDANEVRVYFEFSNECPWNYLSSYCNTQAGLEANVSTGPAWYGYRAAQCMELIRTSFGTDSGVKWAGVLGGQAANTYMASQGIIGAQSHIDNDGGSATAIDELFSHLSITNYLGATVTSGETEPGATLLSWAAVSQEYFNQQLYTAQSEETTAANTGAGELGNIANIKAMWAAHKTIADGENLTLLPYEGGGHNVCGNPLRDSDGTLNTAFAYYQRSEQFANLQARIFTIWWDTYGTFPSQWVLVGVHTKFWNAAPYENYGDINPVSNMVEAWNKGIDAPDPKRRYMLISLSS